MCKCNNNCKYIEKCIEKKKIKMNKKLYMKLAGPGLLEYCKKNNKELKITNKIEQQLPFVDPFIEIFYDNGDNTQTVYNSNRDRNRL